MVDRFGAFRQDLGTSAATAARTRIHDRGAPQRSHSALVANATMFGVIDRMCSALRRSFATLSASWRSFAGRDSVFLQRTSNIQCIVRCATMPPRSNALPQRRRGQRADGTRAECAERQRPARDGRRIPNARRVRRPLAGSFVRMRISADGAPVVVLSHGFCSVSFRAQPVRLVRHCSSATASSR